MCSILQVVIFQGYITLFRPQHNVTDHQHHLPMKKRASSSYTCNLVSIVCTCVKKIGHKANSPNKQKTDVGGGPETNGLHVLT